METILTVTAETPQEWKNHSSAVWFYLEDAAINRKDFTMHHSDNGFSISVHSSKAIRAKDTLRSLINKGMIRVSLEPVMDNPEIVPVKKARGKKKKYERVSNIKYKSRDDVAVRKIK